MKTVVVNGLKGQDPRAIYDNIIFTYETKDESGNLSRVSDIVFIGDYVDYKENPDELQIKHLLDLFWLQEHDNRIHILLGDQEIKYLLDSDDNMVKTILLEQINKENVFFAYYDHWQLYIHNILTNDFLKDNKIVGNPEQITIQLNQMLRCKMFEPLNKNYKIDDDHRYCGCNQVVAHSTTNGIKIGRGINCIENALQTTYILFEQ